MQKRSNPDITATPTSIKQRIDTLKSVQKRIDTPNRRRILSPELEIQGILEISRSDYDNVASTGAQSHEVISERNDEESSVDDCDIPSD